MKEKNYISQNYKVKVYSQLPCIERYLSGEEWRMFTVVFNHIMTVTKHDQKPKKWIEITHNWLAERLEYGDKKTSERNIKRLEDLGVIRVNRAKKGSQKPNGYQLNWDVINTLAECQIEGKDKNVAMTEVKDVLYTEGLFVSRTEDKNVSQIINKNKSYNKNKNKGNSKPSDEVRDNPNKVSSDEGFTLAEARNSSNRALNTSAAHNPSRTESKAQHNPKERSKTTAAHTNNPRVVEEAEAANLTSNDKSIIALCDRIYNNPNDYTSGELEYQRGNLNVILATYGNRLAPLTVSKLERTISHLDYLLD